MTTDLHKVFEENADQLIKEIQGDILYLGSPYNAKQYGIIYHILSTITKYDIFVPNGKTGFAIISVLNFAAGERLRDLLVIW